MKRVAVLIRSLANGGAEKQAVLLAAALKRKHEVRIHVVCREPCHVPHVEFLGRHGLAADFLPPNPLAKAWALARALRRQRVQVLFTFLPSDTLLGALAGRWAGVPRVFGGLRNTSLARRKVAVLRLLHNYMLEATISNSRRAVRHFEQRGFRASKLRVVPNGIELRPLSRRLPRPAGGLLTVLTVARFVAKKDPRAALQALAVAARELSGTLELRYVMVGYGTLESQVRTWIRELELEQIVEVRLDPPSVEALYREADIYLSSSRHEGLSNSILEAMNAGLPIVATDAGDTDLLVDDGVNGALVGTGDAQALGRAIVKLARDPALRERMGAESHRMVAEGFSFERFRADYEDLLDEPAGVRT